jgi:hypothetical protein
MTETSRAFAGAHGAMNNWDKIWKKRTAEIENRATVFEIFKELKRADVGCEEALRVPTEPRYDVVLADSVFQYFNDAAYGQKVLERMWAKAGKMVVVTEVHDQEKKDEHMAYRRKCVENYDEVYAGLDKTFYTREMFLQFAEEHGGRCEIVQPDNELYWNNRFVFDCYLYKE